jgi:hypothetical protein
MYLCTGQCQKRSLISRAVVSALPTRDLERVFDQFLFYLFARRRSRSSLGATFCVVPSALASEVGDAASLDGDVLSHHFDDVLFGPIIFFPDALFHATGDDDANALLQNVCCIISKLSPCDDVEVGSVLFPFVCLGVLPAAVTGNAELELGDARIGVFHFRVLGYVAATSECRIVHFSSLLLGLGENPHRCVGCTLTPVRVASSTMPMKNADLRLKIIKHITVMLLAISDDDESLTDAELDEQYNDAEEWADLLLESMGFTITETTDDDTITATCKLEDIEAFFTAKSEEYLVAENL